MQHRSICLYSSVGDKQLFSRVGFYRDDVLALSSRCSNVYATNSLRDLFKLRPGLVVGYFYSKALLAAIIGRIIRAEVILTGGADQISPILQKGIKLYIHRCLAFLCLLFANKVLLSCTDDVHNFKNISLGISRLSNKIKYAPHVVQPSPLKGRTREPVPGEFHAFTICWMGSVENVVRKGVDRAIRLVAMLRDIGIDATLEVAGTGGPGLEYLQRIAEELSVASAIRFLGPISEEEKNKKYSFGSVYIQLSLHEGFGVAAAEAFFSGMLVVHSNKGGLSDVIGESGYILDIEELVNSGASGVHDFYRSFLKYRINHDHATAEKKKYSINTRAKSFLL
ncbi:MAG: glycosyltransferase family 4 protein [Sedimenticola sp.]